MKNVGVRRNISGIGIQDENIFETQNNFFPDADATLKACDQKI